MGLVLYYLSHLVFRGIVRTFGIFPIQKNVVLCDNFNGKGYDENPRAIADELLKEKRYKIFWIVERGKRNLKFPEGVTPIYGRTLKYFYTIATAKVWISNVRLPIYFRKRKKQFYIQTWHGGMAYKKIEHDAYDKLSFYYHACMRNDNKNIDVFISDSKWFSNLIKKAFRYSGEILECGSPKNDIFFSSDVKKEKTLFKKELGITEDNILLYMPTFRSDYSSDPFDIDLSAVKNALEKKSGKSWKIVTKMHPNVPRGKGVINAEDFVSIDNYGNTQRAIAACDILITDYSSVAFDAMRILRPVILYAKDEESYVKNERGFYFKLSELPFQVFKDTDEVVKYIRKNKIEVKYDDFIKENGVVMSGLATKSVVDLIKKNTK